MTRKIKIEPEGDFRREDRLTSKIRLKGKWLRKAGFQPGGLVSVKVISPGVMTIRTGCCESNVAGGLSHE